MDAHTTHQGVYGEVAHKRDMGTPKLQRNPVNRPGAGYPRDFISQFSDFRGNFGA